MYNYGQTSINDPMIRQNALQNLFMQLLAQDDESLNNLNIFGNPGTFSGNPLAGILQPGTSPTNPNIPQDPYAPQRAIPGEDVGGLPSTPRAPIYRNPMNPSTPQVPRPVRDIPRLMPTRADIIRFGGIF